MTGATRPDIPAPPPRITLDDGECDRLAALVREQGAEADARHLIAAAEAADAALADLPQLIRADERERLGLIPLSETLTDEQIAELRERFEAAMANPGPLRVLPSDGWRERAEAAEAKLAETERQLEHAREAAAGSHEGIRLWMLDCGELVAKHRERAEAAEEKLAVIQEHRNAACAALRIAETLAWRGGDEATAGRYRAAREALEGDWTVIGTEGSAGDVRRDGV